MANNSKKYVSLTRLSDFLDKLSNKFAALTHKHTISDITDYKVDTALSSTSTNPVQNKVLDAEFEAISTAMNALDLAIDGKADASHNHDDRYYTETEVDSKLSGKANTSHGNHVPTTQTASNKVFLRNDNTWATVTPANIGAAASSHNHTVANITDLTATATELNYMDGVTSNVQTQLDTKVSASRTINGKTLSSNITLSASDVGAYSKSEVYSKSEIDNMSFITIADIDNICIPKITFTISGIQYQAQEGMTWEQWVNSSYNTDGFIIHNTNHVGIATYMHLYLNWYVYSTDTIIPNGTYTQVKEK